MRIWRIFSSVTAAPSVNGHVIAKVLSIAVLAFGAVLAQPQSLYAVQPDAPAQAHGYKLVFADNFDRLDLGRRSEGAERRPGVHTWYPGVWFNSKETTLSNIAADGSILSLAWTRTQAGPDTSITTLSHDKKSFKAWRYGYFEARMRWDVVKGAWPAFWLIPVQDATDQDVYSGLRRSGEIDVFEGQGDHPHTFYGTVHEWINSKTDHANHDNFFQLPKDADMSQFHNYGLLWTPGKVTWYFDNRPLHTEKTPLVLDKQDFFLAFTMQAGVDWKDGDLSGVTADRMTLNVDWVRVWQK